MTAGRHWLMTDAAVRTSRDLYYEYDASTYNYDPLHGLKTSRHQDSERAAQRVTVSWFCVCYHRIWHSETAQVHLKHEFEKPS